MKPSEQTLQEIRKLISEITGVNPNYFDPIHKNGKVRRNRELVLSRYLLMYILKEHAKMTLFEIGGVFNNNHFDHSTVIHAKKTILNYMETEKDKNDVFVDLFSTADDLLQKDKELRNKNEEEKKQVDKENSELDEHEAREKELLNQIKTLKNVEKIHVIRIKELSEEVETLNGNVRLLKRKLGHDKLQIVNY